MILSRQSDIFGSPAQDRIQRIQTSHLRHKMPQARGLTLVEVLVAVTILSIALLAYLTVIDASHDEISDGAEFSIASQAITDSIAQDKGEGYSALSNGTITTPVAGLLHGSMTATIGPMPSAPSNTNIKEIDYVVTWVSAKSGGQVSNTLNQSMLLSNHS